MAGALRSALQPAIRRGVRGMNASAGIPVLERDFANGRYTKNGIKHALADVWTFERDSEVEGWINGPVLNTFAIDEPAFVIDPATGQSLGYRALAGFTNSLLWNRDLSNGVWSGSATVSQNAVGLRGVANTAWTITDDGAGGFENKVQAVSVADDSSTHALAWFAGKDDDETRFPEFQSRLEGGTTTLTHNVQINTKTGAKSVRVNDNSDASDVYDLGDWWLIVIQITNNSTGNTTLDYDIRPAISTVFGSTEASATGSIVYDFGGVYLNSSIAGPPIETEDAPESTAADDATEPLPASCQDGFVWVVHARTPSDTPSRMALGSIDDGSSNNRVRLTQETNGQIRLIVVSAGTLVADMSLGTVAASTDFKVAARISADDFAVSLDGASTQSDSAGAMPTVTAKNIGQNYNGSLVWNSTIALDYLDPDPSAWTDADLQAATS